MLNKFINIFTKPESLNKIKTPDNINVIFKLHFKDLTIGYLSLNNGKWNFKYSTEFINQDLVKPLINFPDKLKEYNSEDLWPFFISRLPGLDRPEIKAQIKKNNIDEENEVELLNLFAKKSISNPFILELQS
ncbi:MAG: HipA N-terminal domain-containing protein [Ignavibacteria bacterium]|nr:HipA N-terminal domain-containing protein [Ignavibacteria bacterium]